MKKPKAKFKDLRNPLAKARDRWLESKEGIACCECRAEGQYLRNRLESAFISGWNACEIGPRPKRGKGKR